MTKEFFPLIENILKLTDQTEKSFGIPRKIRDQNFHGTSVEIYRNGMCHWKNIWFRRAGEEIYRLEKFGTTSRREYFETELKRTYEGRQTHGWAVLQ